MSEILFNKEILLMYLPVVLSVAAVITAVITSIKYRRLFRAYDFFMRGKDTDSLEDFIMDSRELIEDLRDEDKKDKETMRQMNRYIRASFQKKGLVHYDAFSGMGGKMSFAYAMLDYTNSGIILNCMHGRDGCFLYIKEVDNGATDTPLGVEEKEALERALGYIKD